MRIAAVPGPSSHRYFFALKPDEITARRTYAFAQEQFGSRGLVRADRHHITLAITQDHAAPEQTIAEALLRAGEQVRAAPFEIVLERLNAGARSIALRPDHAITPLKALHRELARAMAREGVALREGWSFSPHQTLAYREGAPFSRLVEPFRWQAGEFVLVHSHVGLTRHEILGRWPLCPAQEAQLSLF